LLVAIVAEEAIFRSGSGVFDISYAMTLFAFKLIGVGVGGDGFDIKEVASLKSGLKELFGNSVSIEVEGSGFGLVFYETRSGHPEGFAIFLGFDKNPAVFISVGFLEGDFLGEGFGVIGVH